MKLSKELFAKHFSLKAADLEALHAHISTLGTAVDELRPPSLSWAPRGFGFLDSEGGNRLAAFSYAD